jgi:hypothetical protein
MIDEIVVTIVNPAMRTPRNAHLSGVRPHSEVGWLGGSGRAITLIYAQL